MLYLLTKQQIGNPKLPPLQTFYSPTPKLDHFCKDDTVVSRNTFLPPGQAERNETTWSKVDVENEVRVVDQFL